MLNFMVSSYSLYQFNIILHFLHAALVTTQWGHVFMPASPSCLTIGKMCQTNFFVWPDTTSEQFKIVIIVSVVNTNTQADTDRNTVLCRSVV